MYVCVVCCGGGIYGRLLTLLINEGGVCFFYRRVGVVFLNVGQRGFVYMKVGVDLRI